ncbi:Apoptotic chromatin condensation inducer in the nucleus [Dinochytrium kinnereticum]|nr:Apoptotic chromatin condensation inducer in the nucleus [Dinochytrium kinnereticum]
MSVPDALTFDDHVFDFTFHPDGDLMAAALINGEVVCKHISTEAPSEPAFIVRKHTESCRAAEFSADGLGMVDPLFALSSSLRVGSCYMIAALTANLFSGGADRSLVVTDPKTGKMKLRKPDAHRLALSPHPIPISDQSTLTCITHNSEPINRLLSIGPGLVASGDDAGVVKVWDVRQKKEVRKYTDSFDYITDLAMAGDGKTLLATSGDGTLKVYDITRKKAVRVSDNQEAELLSVSFIRNDKKAIVGTDDGVLLFFSAGNWGDCTDRFPGHPNTIDTICKIDDDTIVTGAGDGLLRVIGIFPNRLIRVMGDHGDSTIERLRLSPDGMFVGSCAHDNQVRFWSTEEEEEGEEDDEQDEENENEEGEDKERGEEDSEDDSDGDSDDKDSKPKVSGKPSKRRPQSEPADSSEEEAETTRVKKTRKKAKRGIGGTRKTNFFADMD